MLSKSQVSTSSPLGHLYLAHLWEYCGLTKVIWNTATKITSNIWLTKYWIEFFDFDELAMSYFTTAQSETWEQRTLHRSHRTLFEIMILIVVFTEVSVLWLILWFNVHIWIIFWFTFLLTFWFSIIFSWNRYAFPRYKEILFPPLEAASFFPLAELRILIKHLSICTFASHGFSSLGKWFST